MALCEHCKKKKVGVIPYNCNCGYNNLCSKCRLPEEHSCSFDFKSAAKEKLIKENPVVIKSKVDKI